MSREASVAPRERINIKYRTATDGQEPTGELPLRMLIVGDFTMKPEEDLVEDRKSVSVDKNSFAKVLREKNLSLEMMVPNKMTSDGSDMMDVTLKFEEMSDFEPDSIVQQIPELKKLLELREQLMALRSKVANEPKFRRRIQELLTDDSQRSRFMDELGLKD